MQEEHLLKIRSLDNWSIGLILNKPNPTLNTYVYGTSFKFDQKGTLSHLCHTKMTALLSSTYTEMQKYITPHP